MDPQFSNALLTMSLRRLVMFLHFETYALANPRKQGFCRKSGCELDFLPHISRSRLSRGGGWTGFKGFEGVLMDISDF